MVLVVCRPPCVVPEVLPLPPYPPAWVGTGGGPPVQEQAHLARATEYTLAAATVAPPLTGEVRLNNVNQASVTTIWVAHMNAVGEDCANIFRMLESSSRIFIQDLDNSAAYQIYRLNGNPVDNLAGKYITFSVIWLSGGTSVPVGERCFIGL